MSSCYNILQTFDQSGGEIRNKKCEAITHHQESGGEAESVVWSRIVFGNLCRHVDQKSQTSLSCLFLVEFLMGSYLKVFNHILPMETVPLYINRMEIAAHSFHP